MSAGGFLDSMNKTIKSNRGLVNKISVFDRISNYYSTRRKYKTKVSFLNKLSADALKKLRERTIRKDKIHSLWQIFKMILALAAIVFLLWVFTS